MPDSKATARSMVFFELSNIPRPVVQLADASSLPANGFNRYSQRTVSEVRRAESGAHGNDQKWTTLIHLDKDLRIAERPSARFL